MKKSSLPLFTLIACLFAALSLTNAGCNSVTTSANPGSVAYVNGTLETTLKAPLEAAVKATDAAIGNLKFEKVSLKQEDTVAKFVAKTAEERRIDIVLSKADATMVLVKIHVGVFGEESSSRRLLEAIKDNL